MVTRDDEKDNKRSEGGEKRCFDLFATLLLALGEDDETRASRGKEVQERNMLMIHTITTAATNTFLLGSKRKIDHDHDCKNQDNTSSSSSSSSLVESKRRRVESDEEPIGAEPIRAIKPPVRERKAPVKQKEPVRRDPEVTPDWLANLMRTYNGVDAKLVIEKVITKTDLTPSQGRLLIPFKQIAEEDFLNERELNILEEHHSGDRKQGLDVILLNSNDVEERWNANLRIWEMRTSFNYALCSGWNLFVRQNDLAVNQTRRLWSFHSRDGTLCLAFNPSALALVPVTHAASSSYMDDPFVCEELNRILSADIPRQRRTPRVCVNLLECGGFDLNTTPPPECTEMVPHLEALVQETHFTSTSQESLTETSQESFTETTVDLELRL